MELCKRPELLVVLCRTQRSNRGTNSHRDLLMGVEKVVQWLLTSYADKVTLTPPNYAKPTYLNMMDKNECPSVSHSYVLTTAFACILDTIKCLSSLVKGPLVDEASVFSPESSSETAVDNQDESAPATPTTNELKTIVNGVIGPSVNVLNSLLEFSTSETSTDAILRALQTLLRITGTLGMTQHRDVIIKLLCRHALPRQFSIDADVPTGGWQVDKKQLQVVYVVLNSALCLGPLLESAWQPLIVLMQELVAILDLPHPDKLRTSATAAPRVLATPTKRSHRRSNSNSTSSSSGGFLTISASVAAEVPALGAMLAQIFEMCHNLDDAALQHLVSALCQQSERTMDLISTSTSVTHTLFRNEAYLFAVVQLETVGLANLDRLMVLWPAVTAHLIEVSACTNTTLQTRGVHALTKLVHAALAAPRDPPMEASPGLQQAVLSPLRNLSTIDSLMVSQNQLECVKKVLDSCGQSLAHAWPVVIGIINDVMGHTTTSASDAATVRLAFECMQMIITDFQHTVPSRCFPLLLSSLGLFGRQEAAVNVALTAVESLWNVADYLQQNKVNMQERLEQTTTESLMPHLDEDGLPIHVTISQLWVELFQQLAKLCTDTRPDVRRSACQSFFLTLNTHGPNLELTALQQVICDILLPLLAKIQTSASTPLSDMNQAGLRMHHSYDTPAKQWAETKCLTVQGLAQVISAAPDRLQQIESLGKVWDTALDLFSEWMKDEIKEVVQATAMALTTLFGTRLAHHPATLLQPLGMRAMQTWIKLCLDVPQVKPVLRVKSLTTLARAVEPLYSLVHSGFNADHALNLCKALRALVSFQHADVMAITRVTDLQQAVLDGIALMFPSAEHPQVDADVLRVVFDEVVLSISYAYKPPYRYKDKSTFTGMSMAAMEKFQQQYTRYAEETFVVKLALSAQCLHALLPVLKDRYAYAFEVWQAANKHAIVVIDFGLRGLAANADAPQGVVDELWKAIVSCLEHMLFPLSGSADTWTKEQVEVEHRLDVDVVRLIRDTMLPVTRSASRRGASSAGVDVDVRPETVETIRTLLQRGGVRAINSLSSGESAQNTFTRREHLTQACFQALLDNEQASTTVDTSLDPDADNSNEVKAARASTSGASVSVTDLVQSCVDALVRLSNSPTVTPQLEQEVTFVLNAASAVISRRHRQHAVKLYPHLVACVGSASAAVRQALQAALLKYQPLFDEN
eukprot:TRINITY_DN11663_c0_g1_i1.p1 TRINITY_DN11663_c0_g1~~TRINITY_DN11663_c0_g1_i1.p1  ORF type:complete len:1268 (+),score=326.03 TRINITY_DN11663_c0_g1_i1:194-3805(+)